jgi:HK97 gp10 family phage protein
MRKKGGRSGFVRGTITGGRQVYEILKAIGEETVEAAKEETKRQAEIIAADARQRCPVDTGALRDSIKVVEVRGGLVCRISANARNSKGKAWPDFAYGQIVEFAPPHKGGRPFLYPAFDAHRDAAQQAIYDAVQKAWREAKGAPA